MGYSGARIADSFADASANEEGVTPLKPGEDPLEALSPELRELVLSTEPAAVDDDGITVGDRVKGTLTGMAVGGVLGFFVANFTARRNRIVGAAPMNMAASLTFAGIGAAIGGASGFLRGRNPIDVDEQRAVDRATGAPTTPTLTGVGDAAAGASTASHPAFASLAG